MVLNKSRMNITIENETKEKIKYYSDKLGITMNGFINVCIAEYIKQDSAIDFMKFAEQMRDFVQQQENRNE